MVSVLFKERDAQFSRTAAWEAKTAKLLEELREEMKELNTVPLWCDGTRKKDDE